MSKDGKVVIDIEADDSGFKSTVDDVGKEAKDAADGLDDLGDSAKDAGDGLSVAEVAAGNFIANALTNLVSSIGNAVSSFFELSESTREMRDDMAKLETAFSTNGHSTEAASKAYEDFYAILGESDRSVEAVNHLAELTKNEEELSKWSTIAAGVTAKFGDSLPIEGLTEAANETAKVGATTGVLADALNWASADSAVFEKAFGNNKKAMWEFNKALKEGAPIEDAFTAALGKMTTEEERSAAITETLNGIYADAAAEYNELTASTQDARRATSEMEAAQREIGAALEPVTTAWTRLKADAFEAIAPVIERVVEAGRNLLQWAEENPEKAEAVKGALLGVATALGTLVVALSIAPAINAVKNAFALLNATLLANPISIIVAALAGLVAAFIYLWNNCDAFREFWINLWAKIKEAFSAVVAWIKETAPKIAQFFKDAWKKIAEVWDNSIIKQYFLAIWNTIKGVFSVVKAVLSGNWSDAWAAIKGIVNTWREYFASVWAKIKDIFSPVGAWFGEKFRAAKDSILDAFGNIKKKFTEIKDKILGVFKSIKDDFVKVGDNIVTGIFDGITAGWDWLVGKVKGLANALFGAAQEELDSHSPSRRFAELGKTIPQGVAVGIEKESDKAVSATRKMTTSIASVMKKSAEETETTINKRMEDLVTLGEKYDTEVENIWTTLGNDISTLMDAYNTELENKTKSIAASLGLWAVAEKNTEVTASDLTTALGSQIDLLTDYNTAIGELAGRGVDAEFLDEIKALGVDATGEIEALNSMSDEELAKYVDMWKEKSQLARQAATEELSTLREGTLAQIETLTTDAVIKYEELRADYQEQAKLLATELSAAMKSTGEWGYLELIGQLDKYTSAGEDLMDGVIEGVALRAPAVAQAVSSAVALAIEAAKQTAGIASPSKVMRDEVGKNLGLGLGEGWERSIAAVKDAMTSDVSDLTARVQATVSAENAKASNSVNSRDTGIYDLARAVGTQTAGIASLASEYRRGTGSMRPIILELNGRELGRAVVDVGSAEETRVGTRLAFA